MATQEKNLPGSQGRFKQTSDGWAAAPKPFTEDHIVGSPYCEEHQCEKTAKIYYHESGSDKHPIGSSTHLGRYVCSECDKEHGVKAKKSPIYNAEFQAALRRRNAGIPASNQHCTLSNYLPESEEQEAVYYKILDYAGCLNECEYKNLIMYGNSGTGKSHFGCALVIETCRERKGLYTTATALIADIGESMSSNIPETVARAKYTQPEVLFVDEVKQHGRNELDRFLYPVVEYRLSQKKSTIFATNHPIGMFVNVIGPNLTDKIKTSCLSLKFDWASHRGQPILETLDV